MGALVKPAIACVRAFGERRVRLDDDAVLLAEAHDVGAREVRAEFDLRSGEALRHREHEEAKPAAGRAPRLCPTMQPMGSRLSVA